MRKLIASTIILGMVLISNSIQAGCSSYPGNATCSLNSSLGDPYYSDDYFYVSNQSMTASSHVVSLANDGGAQVTATPDYEGSGGLSDYVYGSINTDDYNYGSLTTGTNGGTTGYVEITIQLLGGGGYGYLTCNW